MYQAPFFPYSRPSQSVQIYFDDAETLRSYHISWVHVETLIKKKEGHELNKLFWSSFKVFWWVYNILQNNNNTLEGIGI